MNRVIANRASAILYNWLITNQIVCKVILPANICESVPAAYMKAGCDLIFCDIELESYCMSVNEIMSNINKNDKVVLHFNHTYGYIDLQQRIFLLDLKEEYPNILIVEDCCLCIPWLNPDKFDEGMDMVLFSTGNTKVANIGYGGYAFIGDTWEYRTQITEYSENDLLGFEKHVKECHSKYGTRMREEVFLANWIEENIGDTETVFFNKVKRQIGDSLSHKKVLNEIYCGLPGSMKNEYSVWRYNLLLQNASFCKKVLFDNGLYCSSHYMSLGNGYWSNKKTPNCDYVYEHVINLFNDFCYTEEQAYETKRILMQIAIPI